MPTIKVLVLTKKDSVERQENIKEQFKKINIPFEFFYGLDTNNLFKGLTAKETNCSINHYVMAEYARTTYGKSDYVVFLEDDIKLEESFIDILMTLDEVKAKRNFSVLLLGTFIKDIDGNDCTEKSGLNNYESNGFNYFNLPDYAEYYGAHGYCVPTDKLLDLSAVRLHCKTHADAWSYFNRISTLDILHVYPHIVNQNDKFDSLIGTHSLMPF